MHIKPLTAKVKEFISAKYLCVCVCGIAYIARIKRGAVFKAQHAALHTNYWQPLFSSAKPPSLPVVRFYLNALKSSSFFVVVYFCWLVFSPLGFSDGHCPVEQK